MSKIEVLGGDVNVNEKKGIIKIWDESLVIMFENLLEQKFSLDITIQVDWEEMDLYLITHEDPDRLNEKQIREAFGEIVEGDLDPKASSHRKSLNGFLFKELFNNTNVTIYNGDQGGRGEAELVFDLEDEEFEHFQKLA